MNRYVVRIWKGNGTFYFAIRSRTEIITMVSECDKIVLRLAQWRGVEGFQSVHRLSGYIVSDMMTIEGTLTSVFFKHQLNLSNEACVLSSSIMPLDVIKEAMQILDRNAGKINEYVERHNGRLINKLDVKINGGPISKVQYF